MNKEDEQRLQMITEQLIIVRDNLFQGMSKSMQKLQARSINEVLELPNFTQSPQLIPLSEEAIEGLAKFVAVDDFTYDFARAIEKAHGITK
jgi:hypothetical protein